MRCFSQEIQTRRLQTPCAELLAGGFLGRQKRAIASLYVPLQLFDKIFLSLEGCTGFKFGKLEEI